MLLTARQKTSEHRLVTEPAQQHHIACEIAGVASARRDREDFGATF